MKFTNHFPCVVISLCCYAVSSSSSTTPIVDLGYAQYQGVPSLDPASNVTNTHFLGLRYAAAPTGSLRFRVPQLPLHTSGVQLANDEPSRCFNAGRGSAPTTPFRAGSTTTGVGLNTRTERPRSEALNVPGFSEDCLFLNVYVPNDLGDKNDLPVVFWIHGGGYIQGSASGFSGTDVYDGNDLIRESGGGVIAVVVQYRLGVFGFLPGEKAKEGGVLNAGLLDQQAALHWVQQHIGKFGGDPKKVTIWGESAGAGSVLQHIIANGGHTSPPLFRAAITSSTFLPSQYRYNDRIPEIIYTEVVSQTNCSSANHTLECLRSVHVDMLQKVNVDINNSGFFGTFVFVPVVDGIFITERPTELLKQNKVNGEIILAVTNTFEGASFVDEGTAPTVQVADYVSQLFPNFGSEQIDAVVAQYAGLGTNFFQVIAIMGESIFTCPTYYLLRAFDGQAFKGEFAVPPGGHGEDIAFYFPSHSNMINNITTFDKSFSESFLKFAMSLNTSDKWDKSDITPAWGLWEGATEILFNVTEAGAPNVSSVKTSSTLLERCQFWEGVSTFSSQ